MEAGMALVAGGAAVGNVTRGTTSLGQMNQELWPMLAEAAAMRDEETAKRQLEEAAEEEGA